MSINLTNLTIMDKFTKEQRIALLNKIINNFEEYSYQEDNDGVIILTDDNVQIQIFPQSENHYNVIYEQSGIYIEDNDSLWRNLPETLRNRNFNLEEKKKYQKNIENENIKQEKLNKYLGL